MGGYVSFYTYDLEERVRRLEFRLGDRRSLPDELQKAIVDKYNDIYSPAVSDKYESTESTESTESAESAESADLTQIFDNFNIPM